MEKYPNTASGKMIGLQPSLSLFHFDALLDSVVFEDHIDSFNSTCEYAGSARAMTPQHKISFFTIIGLPLFFSSEYRTEGDGTSVSWGRASSPCLAQSLGFFLGHAREQSIAELAPARLGQQAWPTKERDQSTMRLAIFPSYLKNGMLHLRHGV
jgi:hypothetical protein